MLNGAAPHARTIKAPVQITESSCCMMDESRNFGPAPCVWVVDDTPDNLFLMGALLEDLYRVRLMESGTQALQAVAAGDLPDLLLLDIMMPDMDGYEVIRRLRANPAMADIPVIFLTALNSVDEEQKGLDLGAADYIAKPISPPVVLARVQSHLERSVGARRLALLSRQLSRYLAPQVVQTLLDGTQDARIRTRRKRLTVFFSDIVGFTGTTSTWQPEDITEVLNQYFSEMAQIVAAYGGTLDKFIGDGMVVFFGDPTTLGARHDALQCVRMAIAMQKRMDELQHLWRDVGCNEPFRIRIGINTGYCDVGNFGSEQRMDYTIIGPEVNLAARLEQAAQPGTILMSGKTWALVREAVDTEPHDAVVAKGFAQPIEVHRVLATHEAKPAVEAA